MFQKKHTISNLAALISYNKRFLYAAVGGTHNERILKESSFFDEVLNGREIPDGKISLSGFFRYFVSYYWKYFSHFSWMVK